MTAAIPAQVQVLIDPSLFPTIQGESVYDVWRRQPGNENGTEADFLASTRAEPGPGGAGQLVSAMLPPGATTMLTTFDPTELKATINPQSTNSRIKLEISGAVSNIDGWVTQFKIYRKIGSGAFEDLTPPGCTAAAVVRSITIDRLEPLSLMWVDAPQTIQPVTYALYWKVHGGIARLGKRDDDLMMIPTIMTLTETP